MGEAPPSKQDPKDSTPAWVVSLPPQLKDAWVRGDFERIPPEYRELIQRYLMALSEAARAEEQKPRAR